MRMNHAQSHRGPNGAGIFEDSAAEISLSHVRLSILDLSNAANQPMHSKDGRFVLIFNGEIYNFRELRAELVARGCTFSSTGDTEVLLQGLAIHGIELLSRLNGIFAFAFWDREERELLIARDQMGVKPLYFAEPSTGILLFASEIKAIFALSSVRREPDFVALQQHLAYCHASDHRTAFVGIHTLPPGHYIKWTASRQVTSPIRYWAPPFHRPHILSRARATEVLRENIKDAVERQLVSDVPVGMLLSGGLDSSVIATLASEAAKDRLSSYTIRFAPDDNRLDQVAEDLPYAREVASQLGLSLHEVPIDASLVDLLPKLIYHLDEPLVDPAAISCYLMCQVASHAGSRVVLSGQGGDELFCGYPRYLVAHATRWIDGMPIALREFAANSGTMLPGSLEGASGALMRRLRRVLVTLDQSVDHRFLGMCANTGQSEIDKILAPDVRASLAGTRFDADCVAHMQREGLQGLQRLQERDLSIYLPNHNLLYTDKMGMASGVEVRVPLLDLALVNEAVRYDYSWQLHGRTTKSLFRDATRSLVPQRVTRRRKAGLGAPYRKWLRYDLQELWNDLMSADSVKARGWFKYDAIQDARARSQAGKVDLYMLQWALLTIELWARRFIDRNPLVT